LFLSRTKSVFDADEHGTEKTFIRLVLLKNKVSSRC
jgi:hypothetical protein